MKNLSAVRKAHFITALIYSVVCLLLGIYRIADTGSFFNLFKCWVSVLYLLIPPILCLLFRKKPSYTMNLCLYGFLFVAYTLGVAMEWYHLFALYDLVAHFISGVFFALVGCAPIFFLRRDRFSPLGSDPPLSSFFTFVFSGFVAGFWEILEHVSSSSPATTLKRGRHRRGGFHGGYDTGDAGRTACGRVLVLPD